MRIITISLFNIFTSKQDYGSAILSCSVSVALIQEKETGAASSSVTWVFLHGDDVEGDASKCRGASFKFGGNKWSKESASGKKKALEKKAKCERGVVFASVV